MRAPKQSQPRRAPALAKPREEVRFISSGNRLLDLTLGGGWACRRVANIVGDSAAGKTLLAVEACVNFLPYVRSPDDIRYVEGEMAYDIAYGEQIGMPPEIKPVDDIGTVEDFFDDLSDFIRPRQRQQEPSLYVLDSLDALSDEAEQKRGIRDATFGTNKAAQMSETFRRINGMVSKANVTLLIVSQLRDKIGVTFGEKKTRAGGNALQFYCSQIVWLAEIKKITRTVRQRQVPIGGVVRARCRKNKVGMPHRECQLNVLYNYGVDDETSMLDYLEEIKFADTALLKDLNKQLLDARYQQNREWLNDINAFLSEIVTDQWMAVEEQLAPAMRKYG